MAKKLMMNNYSGNNDVIVLCKDFSPNGQPFVLWENQMIDWDKYELYIEVDFTNCIGSYENVLSIGLNIKTWLGENLHVYYNYITNSLQIAYVGGGDKLKANISMSLTQNKIIINKDGVFINNVRQSYYESHIAYKSVMNSLFNNDVTIGSQEGGTRSNATYNLVQLQPYQERS